MPIDIISSAPGARTQTKVHMVRPSTEMVIREGKGFSVYSAMGVCGTEAKGIISVSEKPSDVSCERCHRRAEAVLAADAMDAAEPAPVLSAPETVSEPRRRVYSPGRERHGKVTAERQARRHRMKELVRELATANPQR